MSHLSDEEREALGEAWPAGAAHVATTVEGIVARHRAEALREVTLEWQTGAWADVMTPKPVGFPALDYGQRVTDWLRDRADRIGG